MTRDDLEPRLAPRLTALLHGLLAGLLLAGCASVSADDSPVSDGGQISGDSGDPLLGPSTPPRMATDLTLKAPFTGTYAAYDLGAIPGVPPARYGGLALKADNPDTLLVGGRANLADATIYAVPLVRGGGRHIVGLGAQARAFAAAPNIDGGLAYGAGNVLFFTAYPNNSISQIRPGEPMPGRTTNLTPLGVPPSVGALNFVPAGFGGAKLLKLVSFAFGSWYQVNLAEDPASNGLFKLAGVQVRPQAQLSGGPEGFAYVPQGSPRFDRPSLLVAEWSSGTVAAYEADPQGDPLPMTRREVLTDLNGAEGALFDAATGDFLFSTMSGLSGRLIIVQGFKATGS